VAFTVNCSGSFDTFLQQSTGQQQVSVCISAVSNLEEACYTCACPAACHAVPDSL
jgi:hypothetical protein